MKTINIHMTSSRITAKRTPFRDKQGRFRSVRYSSIVDLWTSYGAEVHLWLKLNHELQALKATYKERYGKYPKEVCLPLRYGRVLGLKVGQRIYGMRIKDIGHGVRTPLVLID